MVGVAGNTESPIKKNWGPTFIYFVFVEIVKQDVQIRNVKSLIVLNLMLNPRDINKFTDMCSLDRYINPISKVKNPVQVGLSDAFEGALLFASLANFEHPHFPYHIVLRT